MLERRAQHGAGVHVVGKRHPHEEAALGARPRRLGREVLVERRQHRVATRAIGVDERAQRLLPRGVGEVVLHHHLVERAAAQIGALLHKVDLRQHALRRHDPTRAQTRREHLRHSAEVHHVVRKRLERQHVAALVAQAAIGVILHHHEAVLVRQFDEALATRGHHGDAAGVLEVRNGVEELEARIAFADARKLLFQQIHAHALVIEGDAADIRLVGRERLQRAEVGGAFGQHDVARIDERLGDEVERLLRARGDHDVLRLGAHADVAHEVAEHALRLYAAIGGAVLQRHGALIVARRAGGLADGRVRQKRHVGHAARQRDDVGVRRSGEQIAHGRRAHLHDAVGDLVARVVECQVSRSHWPRVPPRRSKNRQRREKPAKRPNRR